MAADRIEQLEKQIAKKEVELLKLKEQVKAKKDALADLIEELKSIDPYQTTLSEPPKKKK